jgi:hypothetical protein
LRVQVRSPLPLLLEQPAAAQVLVERVSDIRRSPRSELNII